MINSPGDDTSILPSAMGEPEIQEDMSLISQKINEPLQSPDQNPNLREAQ